MKDFPNFLGKIERGRLEDLQDAVEVTEKMDGSYFQFGWYKGEFRMRTKSTLDHEGINKMFNKAINGLNECSVEFPKDTIFCCEYFQKPKHNAISYDFSNISNDVNGDSCFIFIIDIYATGLNPARYFPSRVGNCQIRLIKHLNVSEESSDPWRMAEGAYGAIREGIVVKNSKGERFKFVTDHFKEVHGGVKRPRRQYKEVERVWEPYVLGLKARIDKAIFRLKERGIEFSKDSFGKVIGETVNDLLEEERSNIEKDLFKFYEKPFKKLVNRNIIDILFDKIRENGEANE